MRTTDKRRRRVRFGRFAEVLCAWHLRLRGYRILAQRFRTPLGELDEGTVFLRLEEAQALFGLADAVSEIVVVTTDRDEGATLREVLRISMADN